MRPVAMKTLSISFAALLLSAASGARADCALGATYDVSNSAPNSVTVCLISTGLDCSTTAQVMLRQDTSTGAIVQIANFCSSATAAQPSCFIDECVPEGSYRYGLADPFTCADKGCGNSVPYFIDAQVTTALTSSCARSAGDPGPTATTAAAPWGASATESLTCPGASGCSTSGLNTNIALLDLCAIAIALVWFRLRKRA